MQMLRWLPVAFIAGTHGFAMFAPYLVLILAAVALRRARARRLQPAPVFARP